MEPYKVGDKIVVRSDLKLNTLYGYAIYKLYPREEDVRGKECEIITVNRDTYDLKGYSRLSFEMIDHEKTRLLTETVNDTNYAIY